MASSNTVFEKVINAPGAVLITDEKGDVVYANKAVEKKTGYFQAQIVGSRPGKMWGGNMSRHFYSLMWDTLEKKNTFHGIVKNIYKGKQSTDDYINIFTVEAEKKFHIELTPKDLSSHDLHFLKSDMHIMNAQDNAQALDRFLFWLNGGKQHSIVGFMKLSSFISENLIDPLNKSFSSRSEDAKLIKRSKETPYQYTELYNKYYEDVYLYILPKVSHSEEVAEDIAQHVFERAFQHLETFKVQNATYKTFLLRIAHNLVVNRYRIKKLEPLPEEYVHAGIEEKVDASLFVEQAMRRLNEAERRAIKYKYMHDLKISEIAVLMGKTENAIKLHLSRARKKMRQVKY